jgi:2-oxoglutarate ferredoxin oxidoreductase subunit alpha
MSDRTLLTGKHFMNGDHACAEGAIAAGCRFFGGYPITPSTEIAERLALRLPEVGGVFIQMEDELASMASILGASAAGSRAMTATSGPGFSLMMENLGLGVMLEIPCLVVDVQRGSPSTGLPTMAGQSDVMQARWGSHGDYEIVAYAPWSPQEMFDLTVLSFNVADRYRVPVLLMADEVVGHMVERVEIPSHDQIERWERKRPKKSPNNRERGYPDMSAETHQQLVTRLVKKVTHNAEQIMRTESYHLEDARILVIAYGCTARSARRAVRLARQQGIPVGLLRLISLWPFPEKMLREIANTIDTFIVAEMNLGQMRLEVERVVQNPVIGVHHAGGQMIAPETILEEISKCN